MLANSAGFRLAGRGLHFGNHTDNFLRSGVNGEELADGGAQIVAERGRRH